MRSSPHDGGDTCVSLARILGLVEPFADLVDGITRLAQEPGERIVGLHALRREAGAVGGELFQGHVGEWGAAEGEGQPLSPAAQSPYSSYSSCSSGAFDSAATSVGRACA